MKFFHLFLLPLCLGILISCQEKDPAPETKLPSTGCDGDLTGTNCQQFFIAAGETLSFPAGTEISASEGIEINGDIVIDPAAGGDFTLTATSGDIVISGKILVKDTTDDNSSGGRHKNGKSTSRLKNGKAADGFTLTLDARGANGNIILKKGATLFSGRGQHAPDEILTSLSGSYEGAAGGNGGLIILNAPNGKVKLPNVGNTVIQFQDEVFVLGNGGNGANIVLDANLETGELDVVEVRGGMGGNAGQLIIDADEIEGVPTLEAMETHPDLIFGGEGGHGGFVVWNFGSTDKKYKLQEIIFHGGDGGDGALTGGYGGAAVFFPPEETIVNIGDPIPQVYCYGGHGGDVFASPLPVKEVGGGDGGEYVVRGVHGWHGGEDENGTIFRDGADGGNALGQGGDGGHILPGVKAYKAIGGEGGNSVRGRDYIPMLMGLENQNFLSPAFGVAGGNGGNGYSGCDGCPGGDGGYSGKAIAVGGKGGDVQGEAIQSFGGHGGDIWAVMRGWPGNGGNGNPGGKAGGVQEGSYLQAYDGEAGSGDTPGESGLLLGFDLYADLIQVSDGETCGEDLECAEDTLPTHVSCTGVGAYTSIYYKATNKTTEDVYTYRCEVSALERDPTWRVQYSWSEKHTYKLAKIINGVQVIYDTTVTQGDTFISEGANYLAGSLPGPKGHSIANLTYNPQCDEDGNLQWPGDGFYSKDLNVLNPGTNILEWQLLGCVSFLMENNEIDRSHTQCCERNPDAPFPYQACEKP